MGENGLRKLVNVLVATDYDRKGAHRALNDVVACWQLLKALNKEEPIKKWINRIGYLSKYGPPKWSLDFVPQVPMVNKYAN